MDYMEISIQKLPRSLRYELMKRVKVQKWQGIPSGVVSTETRCLHACLLACLLARPLACLHACLVACWLAGLLACQLACLLACLCQSLNQLLSWLVSSELIGVSLYRNYGGFFRTAHQASPVTLHHSSLLTRFRL